MGGGAWLRRNDAKSMPLTTPGAGGNGMHSSHRLQAAPLVLLGRNMLGIINIHFSYPGKSDSKRESSKRALINVYLSCPKEGFLAFLS